MQAPAQGCVPQVEGIVGLLLRLPHPPLSSHEVKDGRARGWAAQHAQRLVSSASNCESPRVALSLLVGVVGVDVRHASPTCFGVAFLCPPQRSTASTKRAWSSGVLHVQRVWRWGCAAIWVGKSVNRVIVQIGIFAQVIVALPVSCRRPCPLHLRRSAEELRERNKLALFTHHFSWDLYP